MQEAYKDRLDKYSHIWKIIDNRWNNQLHHPIHAVVYFLTQIIIIRLRYEICRMGMLELD